MLKSPRKWQKSAKKGSKSDKKGSKRGQKGVIFWSHFGSTLKIGDFPKLSIQLGWNVKNDTFGTKKRPKMTHFFVIFWRFFLKKVSKMTQKWWFFDDFFGLEALFWTRLSTPHELEPKIPKMTKKRHFWVVFWPLFFTTLFSQIIVLFSSSFQSMLYSWVYSAG